MGSHGNVASEKSFATVLAIGTANPSNVILQEDYPDFYFKVTNCEHMGDLKEKLKRICLKSKIRKRHYFLTEEILKENPNIASFGAGSLDCRQKIVEAEIPKLGKEAAKIAIKEWGQPVSKITHLVFATTSGSMMPGADFTVAKLLGLNHNIKRVMLYNQGCFAGAAALRVAKDLAENNCGARVLVVCAENQTMMFHAPSGNHLDMLVGQATFADGAAAVIIGANPVPDQERPLFEMVSANQSIIPDSEGDIEAHFLEMGMIYVLTESVSRLIGNYIDRCMVDAFKPFGISDWNSLFYCIHPGGRAIVDGIAHNLGLSEENLAATRHVLSEYGNMGSACVSFVLNEMRKRSNEGKKGTTGDGKEWGVLIGLGPGLTVETIVLRSVPI